ncbi:uncharacterized protein LOC123867747 isoform X2 [Maniola jurtina]|uniref:uncharacterized protein LOC123867747 isoform X2 n=1 Tax=Maniola jurtina TaxID=191418 RepID=UPI001E68E718|nr:uncharacterized protein LOC123867747 isoform X2 [Maniola jurtina]
MLQFQKYIVMLLILLMTAQCYEAKVTFPVQKSALETNSPHRNKTQSQNSKSFIQNEVLLSTKLFKNFTLIIPEKCEELGICEHLPNYPHRLVMRIIKKLLKRNIKFNEDVKQWDDYIDFFEESSRIPEEEDLCKSKSKLYIPQAARDASNTWQLILNSAGAGTTQNFIGEQCEPKYPDCSKMAYFSKPFYRGACVQKFMKRVMYGLNENGVIKTLFDVPSCCACVAIRLS